MLSNKSNEIKEIFCKLINSNNDNELINYLNELEIVNKELKNGLTSKKAIILNGLMCLYTPNCYVSGLLSSENHRLCR
jgi:hypothetical protein